jgi:peptidyl-prolyl cis-trans isomerase D
MLKILRRKGVSKVILWFLAGIIILAFGVFGSTYRMESSADKKQKYAGRVFGQKILTADFQNQLKQTIIMDRINYGNNYEKIKHLLDQDRVQRTWVRLLLLKEAQKRNIVISDQDLIKAIMAYPKFQISDKFNDLYYKDILKNYLQINARDFEECFRDKLKIDNIMAQETATISVTEEETREAYRQYNEKVQVSYLFFANANFKDQVPTDEAAIEKYYQDHKNQFATPPMINVEFLRFSFPKATQTPENQETANISDEDKDNTWRQAYDARQELKTNPDFAAVAAKNSITVEESGFFSMEQPNLKAGWPFELLQKIFEMKSDDISDPIETATGYQILHVKERKDAAMPQLSEIKDIVSEQWKLTQAAQLAQAKAVETLKTIQTLSATNPDFAQIAKDAKLELTQIPAFGHDENYLPKLGPAPDFIEKAFALTTEKPISEIAQTSKGFCIIHLDGRTQADMADFEKEKDKYTNAMLMEKKSKAFNDFLTHLRLKANLESYLPEDKKLFR